MMRTEVPEWNLQLCMYLLGIYFYYKCNTTTTNYAVDVIQVQSCCRVGERNPSFFFFMK